MPRLPDDYLSVIAYLYASEADAYEGKRTGGTGFLVNIPSPKLKADYNYVVTNRHVVERGSSTVRLNGVDGKPRIFDLIENTWSLHEKHDLAVNQLSVTSDIDNMMLSEDHFLKEIDYTQYDIGVGDDIFIPGRLINVDGGKNNKPIMRFGHIAANGTYLVEAEDGKIQESILVEAMSVRGLSGAPVFIGHNDLYVRPNATAQISSRAWLLGVQWGFVKSQIPVSMPGGIPATMTAEANTGIMCVTPAWELWKFLNSEEFVRNRQASDEIGVQIGIPLRTD